MISPSCGKVCSNSKGQKNLGASIQKNFGRFSEKRPKFFLCTFGAKSTKSLRTSFSAGLREPRRCTGRARSSLCATPRRTRRSPHPLFPRQTRVRIDCAANGGIDYLYMAMRFGCPYQLTFSEISIRQCVSLFPARRSPTWFRWRESGRKAESASGGDGLLVNPRIVARRRFQSSGRRQRNRSGGFCCFSPPKSREKRKSFSGVFLQRTKGHRAASRHLYKKKQSTKNTTLQQGSYTFDLPRKQPPSSP